jgi:hypothetical protein
VNAEVLDAHQIDEVLEAAEKVDADEAMWIKCWCLCLCFFHFSNLVIIFAFQKMEKKKKARKVSLISNSYFFQKQKTKTTHVCLLEKIITQSVPLIDWFAVDRLMCDVSLRFISPVFLRSLCDAQN